MSDDHDGHTIDLGPVDVGNTDRGEGAPSSGDASADGSGDACVETRPGVRFPHAPSPHTDPAVERPPTMTTWEDASGEPIFGEFDFMTDRLWIDDADVDEPIEFIRTEWVAARRTKSWRSEDHPECPSCHSEGETPSGAACGRCLGNGFLADPIERVVSDQRWLDPAASATLDELVAVNVAGDIEAVARNIREQRTLMLREWVRDEFPLPPMARWLETWELALEVIAAGIREGQE